jgi:hypothetical protein
VTLSRIDNENGGNVRLLLKHLPCLGGYLRFILTSPRIFHMPDAPAEHVTVITHKLLQANAVPLNMPNRFILEHKFFRSTPPPNPQTKPETPKYFHLLNMSHHPLKTYLCVTENTPATAVTASTAAPPNAASTNSKNANVTSSEAPKGSIIAIPSEQQQEFAQMMISRQAALWTPRQSCNVSGGGAYKLNEYKIRYGEMKTIGPQGGPRGIVVFISTLDQANQRVEGRSDKGSAVVMGANATSNGTQGKEKIVASQPGSGLDGDVASQDEINILHAMIQEISDDFTLPDSSVRRIYSSRAFSSANEETARFNEVSMWCEVLKFRG